MSHCGVSESSWLLSPSCERKDAGLIPATARRPCARRWAPLSLRIAPLWMSASAQRPQNNTEDNKEMMYEKLELSLTASQVCGSQQEALGLISFQFCGSQFHAIAVSNELGCLVWLNSIGCSAYCFWPPSHHHTSKSISITTSVAVTEVVPQDDKRGDERTVDCQVCDKAELNHRLFDFYMYQNIKCCFLFCPSLRTVEKLRSVRVRR